MVLSVWVLKDHDMVVMYRTISINELSISESVAPSRVFWNVKRYPWALASNDWSGVNFKQCEARSSSHLLVMTLDNMMKHFQPLVCDCLTVHQWIGFWEDVRCYCIPSKHPTWVSILLTGYMKIMDLKVGCGMMICPPENSWWGFLRIPVANFWPSRRSHALRFSVE